MTIPLVAGCLYGTYLTTSATLTVSGSTSEWFGYDMVGGLRANADRNVDIAVGAPLSDTVYVFTGDPSGGFATTPLEFTGESGGEAGWALAAGDLVSSSVTDLVIAAPSENSGRGRVYVVAGGAFNSDITADGWVIFEGDQVDEWAGFDVATGDFNGDGDGDVLIAAIGYGSQGGRVYRVDGPWSDGTVVDLTTADFILTGSIGNQLGASVAASDVNGDGADEMIVGERSAVTGAGRVHVIYGAPTGTNTLSSLSTVTSYTGDAANEQLGWTVAGGGDFDADGYEDLLLGAPNEWCGSPGGGLCAGGPGTAYLVRGQSTQLTGGTIGTVADAVFEGTTALDRVGESLALVPSLTNAGYADVVLGARGADKTFLFWGRPPDDVALMGTMSTSSAQAVIDGTATGKWSGASVADAGDLDNDGVHELLVGAPGVKWNYVASSTWTAGEVYVFDGDETAEP